MKHQMQYDKGSLATELASLPNLEREVLMERWRKVYDRPPPVNSSHTSLPSSFDSGVKPRFSAPITLVVMPEECQSMPLTAPKD